MEVDQAPAIAHGHPGTPVSDLFPLGNSVFGSGSRRSLRPIRAGELPDPNHSAKHRKRAEDCFESTVSEKRTH